MSLPPGHLLGAYRIIGHLGAGGMGDVYRATDTRLGRSVALKLLPDSFAAEPERVARFEREARTLASLNHPHIAQIYDVGGRVPGVSSAYIAMELVEGEDLSQRLTRGPLPLAEALKIARQIAQALDAAHEQAIVHRDLKPANIKLREDGTVKVLDFGLAKAMDNVTGIGATGLANSPTMVSSTPVINPGITSVGMILGTAAYMSPEQAKGLPVDKRADIWAFGVVLYEMVTGRPLFTGDTVQEIVAAVLRHDIDLTELPAKTPLPVRRALHQCLERDLRRRLRDMGDLRLEDDEATAPERTVAAPLWRRLAPWAAAATGILGTWLSLRPADTPAPEPTRTTIALPAGTRLPARNRSIALSPNAATLAVVLVDRATERSQLYLRPLDALEFQPLAGTAGATFPFWSPDGRTLGFFAEEQLRRFDVPGGPVRTIGPATEGRGAVWRADDQIIFAAARPPDLRTAGLFRVHAEGRSAPTPYGPDTPSTHNFHSPTLLPGPAGILVSQTSLGRDEVQSWNVIDEATGAATKVLEEASEVTFAAPGWLLYGLDSLLMAQPFDPSGREPSGKAEVLADRVSIDEPRAAANVTQAGGSIVYVQVPPPPLRLLTWYDLAGRALSTVGEPAPYESVFVSPDGTRAVVQMDGSQLWLVDLATGVRSPFHVGPGRRGENVAWSSDGRRVAFRDPSTGLAVVQRVDGTGPTVTLGTLDANAAWVPHSWTPDGQSVILHIYQGVRGFDLAVMAADGSSEPRRLIETPAQESQGSVSPDGRWLVYLSNESGTQQAYVTAFPHPGQRWPVTGAGATGTGWLSTSELFVVDLEGRVTSVSVQTPSGTPVFGTRRSLLGGAPQPGPGRLATGLNRFLFAPRAGSADAEPALVLLTHWPQAVGQ